MTGSRMAPEDLAKEKTVVLSELEGNENDPQSVLDDVVQGTTFQAHPYRWPVIGYKSDVQSFTPEKVRTYYHTYYQPNNAALAIVEILTPARLWPKSGPCSGGSRRPQIPRQS